MYASVKISEEDQACYGLTDNYLISLARTSFGSRHIQPYTPGVHSPTRGIFLFFIPAYAHTITTHNKCYMYS